MKESGYLNSNGGIGFLSALQLILFMFKIFGVVNWSWWWIFSPIWAPIGLAVVFWLIVAAVSVANKRPW